MADDKSKAPQADEAQADDAQIDEAQAADAPELDEMAAAQLAAAGSEADTRDAVAHATDDADADEAAARAQATQDDADGAEAAEPVGEASEPVAAADDAPLDEPMAASSPEEEGLITSAASADEVTPEVEDEDVDGVAAYFDSPDELLHAAEQARDAGFKTWDAFSPFPIHGIEDAMGIGRSWLPWVTFGAGATGFTLANALQFGTMTFDWPMVIGGKPYAPWPSFVPVMFELTVLIGGVTSALVMLIASGCFRKPKIIDPEITNDRFVLWVSASDEKYKSNRADVMAFLRGLDPVEIRPVTFK